jgi:peptide/nickel transport system substrate-binding protein
VKNGGISADAKTWTFHLRPHLVWSDGAPYDARDVDFTWKLWRNPAFAYAGDPTGLTLITSSEVSADHLTIIFHLARAYAPFLAALWVDGYDAPLPAHHFINMPPAALVKSPDNLNPQITSGPFMMSESIPGNHYTLVRNPRYYLASQGLPYLDKVVFRIVESDRAVLKDLQAGTVDIAGVNPYQLQAYQHLTSYTITAPPTSAEFEAMYFNFHNTVLASHLEVRLAIAMALDHQALIAAVPGGFATQLCTDHGSALHPGYQPTPLSCPIYDPVAASKLLGERGSWRTCKGRATAGV